MLDLTFYPSNLKAINEHALRIVKNENDKDGLVRSM
jgi:hypothetical protein